jgi:hypothetical protein
MSKNWQLKSHTPDEIKMSCCIASEQGKVWIIFIELTAGVLTTFKAI